MIVFKDIPVGTKFIIQGYDEVTCVFQLEEDFVLEKIGVIRAQCIGCNTLFAISWEQEVYPVLEQYDVSQD